MADVLTETKTVAIVTEYTDGDTRTLSQSNPLTDQTQLVNAINAFGTYVKNNNILIGDKAGGSFARIREAKIVDKSQIKYDIQ